MASRCKAEVVGAVGGIVQCCDFLLAKGAVVNGNVIDYSIKVMSCPEMSLHKQV